MNRRGQTELIGVVMIAVLLIIGVLIYARVSGDSDPAAAARSVAQEQEAESFLIALLSADVPDCGTDTEGVARACLERDTICVSGDPCGELQEVLDIAVGATLLRHGMRYNLSVEGTAAMNVSDCESAQRKTLLTVGSRQEIIGSGGMPLGKALTLAVCR